MAHTDARAWWADVQHLREGYEDTDDARRRADEAALSSRRASRERLRVEAEVSRLHTPRRDRADGDAPSTRAERRERGREHATAEPPAVSDRLPSRPPARRGPPSGGRGRAQASATFEVFADDVSGRPRRKGSGTPGRATIEIRGRTVPAPELPRATDPERRRSARRPIERVGSRPDRVAMWALLMGLLLILVAIGTAGGPAATIFFAL